MKIAVLSDSHGRMHALLRAMEKLGKVDAVFHLGDVMQDAEDLKIVYPEIPVYNVCGNCDLCAGDMTERSVTLGGKKFFLCHGHAHGVKENLSVLASHARDFDLALFGHTHETFDGFCDGVHLFNPGSVALPAAGAPSCGLITIDDDTVSTEHIYLA